MADRTVVLTGATSGIGLCAACLLAPATPTLVLQGPEPESEVARQLQAVRAAAGPENTVHYLRSDFTEPDAVHRFAAGVAERAPEIDVLVNNAAIPGGPDRTLTDSGVELTFAVNFLSGVLLTNLLLHRIADNGRIVNVASATHFSATLDLDDLAFERRAYSGPQAYAQSKLAIVTYSRWLADRIRPTVVSVHPGIIASRLLHAMFSVGGASPEQGGANLVAAVRSPATSGDYLDERTPAEPNPVATDAAVQRHLHDVTATLLHTDIV